MDSPLVDPRFECIRRDARPGFARQRITDGITGRAWERGRKGQGVAARWMRGPVAHGCAGKVDPAEFARGKGWLVEMGGCADFMMFFDATARPGKRWSGNELESAASYPLFRLGYGADTEARRGGTYASYSRRTPLYYESAEFISPR